MRSLRRSPGLATTIVVTVGLGLGATTTMVTVIEAVVLKPLPYTDQDALVWIYSDHRRILAIVGGRLSRAG